MSSRRQRHGRTIEDLRLAIDCLPKHTRIAMLDGVRTEEIIVGAYVDNRGGVCPMLAAHRRGGRTDFLSFARSWDRFAGARGRARRATERELRVLEAHLEASLLAEEPLDLSGAIAEHHLLVERREHECVRVDTARPDAAERPGDPDRGAELRRASGWAWLRPFRRLDDYERALERVHREGEHVEPELELV